LVILNIFFILVLTIAARSNLIERSSGIECDSPGNFATDRVFLFLTSIAMLLNSLLHSGKLHWRFIALSSSAGSKLCRFQRHLIHSERERATRVITHSQNGPFMLLPSRRGCHVISNSGFGSNFHCRTAINSSAESILTNKSERKR
jgi:hypothetical protein